MTRGKPLQVITAFAVPMILSNLFQQLYNVIDSMIVGNWLGMEAFAAVGCTGMITAVLVQLSMGLSLGGSIVVSQLFGAGRRGEIRTCTTTLAMFMTGLGVLFTVLLTAGCVPLLALIRTPAEAAGYAAAYLRIYALGCVPVFLYNALSGIYTALGNSKTPLRFLIISSVTNIALDLLFIVGFGLGVGGAAAATVISQAAAMLMALLDIPGVLRELDPAGGGAKRAPDPAGSGTQQKPGGGSADGHSAGSGAKRAPDPAGSGATQETDGGSADRRSAGSGRTANGRLSGRGVFAGFGRLVFDRRLLASMLKLALPAALQQSVVSVGNVAVQATVNSFGTTVMAAYAAGTKINNLTCAIPINYGNAFGNYVGQNMGAGKLDRVYRGLRDSCLCSGVIALVMTAVMILFAEPMTGLFIGRSSADPAAYAEAVDIGTRFIRVNGGFMLIFSIYMIVKAVFKGSGDMGWFVFVTMVSFFVRLGLTVGLAHKAGVWIIWWSYGFGYIAALIISIGRFAQGGWKQRKVV